MNNDNNPGPLNGVKGPEGTFDPTALRAELDKLDRHPVGAAHSADGELVAFPAESPEIPAHPLEALANPPQVLHDLPKMFLNIEGYQGMDPKAMLAKARQLGKTETQINMFAASQPPIPIGIKGDILYVNDVFGRTFPIRGLPAIELDRLIRQGVPYTPYANRAQRRQHAQSLRKKRGKRTVFADVNALNEQAANAVKDEVQMHAERAADNVKLVGAFDGVFNPDTTKDEVDEHALTEAELDELASLGLDAKHAVVIEGVGADTGWSKGSDSD